jgi:hypothetical protein
MESQFIGFYEKAIKKEKIKMLNQRQKNLLFYLECKAILDPTAWISKELIVSEIEGYRPNNHHASHDVCALINRDVNAINADLDVDEIIVFDCKNNFKLATEEETQEFANYRMKKALTNFKRYRSIRKKMNRDGQGSIDGDAIRFINSFLR